MDKASKQSINLQLNAGLNKLKSRSESSLLAPTDETKPYTPVVNCNHKELLNPARSPLPRRSLTPSMEFRENETSSIATPYLTKLAPANDTIAAMRSKSPLLPKFSLDSKRNEKQHPQVVAAENHTSVASTLSVDSGTVKPTGAETKVHCSGPTTWRPDLTLKIDVLAIV